MRWSGARTDQAPVDGRRHRRPRPGAAARTARAVGVGGRRPTRTASAPNGGRPRARRTSASAAGTGRRVGRHRGHGTAGCRGSRVWTSTRPEPVAGVAAARPAGRARASRASVSSAGPEARREQVRVECRGTPRRRRRGTRCSAASVPTTTRARRTASASASSAAAGPAHLGHRHPGEGLELLAQPASPRPAASSCAWRPHRRTPRAAARRTVGSAGAARHRILGAWWRVGGGPAAGATRPGGAAVRAGQQPGTAGAVDECAPRRSVDHARASPGSRARRGPGGPDARRTARCGGRRRGGRPPRRRASPAARPVGAVATTERPGRQELDRSGTGETSAHGAPSRRARSTTTPTPPRSGRAPRGRPRRARRARRRRPAAARAPRRRPGCRPPRATGARPRPVAGQQAVTIARRTAAAAASARPGPQARARARALPASGPAPGGRSPPPARRGHGIARRARAGPPCVPAAPRPVRPVGASVQPGAGGAGGAAGGGSGRRPDRQRRRGGAEERRHGPGPAPGRPLASSTTAGRRAPAPTADDLSAGPTRRRRPTWSSTTQPRTRRGRAAAIRTRVPTRTSSASALGHGVVEGLVDRAARRAATRHHAFDGLRRLDVQTHRPWVGAPLRRRRSRSEPERALAGRPPGGVASHVNSFSDRPKCP